MSLRQATKNRKLYRSAYVQPTMPSIWYRRVKERARSEKIPDDPPFSLYSNQQMNGSERKVPHK